MQQPCVISLSLQSKHCVGLCVESGCTSLFRRLAAHMPLALWATEERIYDYTHADRRLCNLSAGRIFVQASARAAKQDLEAPCARIHSSCSSRLPSVHVKLELNLLSAWKHSSNMVSTQLLSLCVFLSSEAGRPHRTAHTPVDILCLLQNSTGATSG